MPYRTIEKAEVARYLHLTASDVERLVKSQDIPFERRGSRIVFRKAEIESWASRRILGLEGARLIDYHEKSSNQMRPSLRSGVLMPELIQPAFIDPGLPAKTKASVLREMAALAGRTGKVYDMNALKVGLEAREALCSTGLPGGLALLHARHHDPDLFESAFMVLGRTVQEIPFGAPDRQPSNLFFLLCCPDVRLHLHAMARLCMMAQKTKMLVLLPQARDSKEMFEFLVQTEEMVLGRK